MGQAPEAASQPPEPESGKAPNSGEGAPVDVHLRTTFRHSVDEGVGDPGAAPAVEGPDLHGGLTQRASAQ